MLITEYTLIALAKTPFLHGIFDKKPIFGLGVIIASLIIDQLWVVDNPGDH